MAMQVLLRKRGPMWTFVDPVNNQAEVSICDFHKNSRSRTYPGLQNTNGFFFSFESALRRHKNYSFASYVTFLKMLFWRKIEKCNSKMQTGNVLGIRHKEAECAAPGFTMLLRNAHSFAVGLCKCSEHNTWGLYCLTELLCIKHQCF